MDLPFSSSFHRVKFEQLSVKLLAVKPSKRASKGLLKIVRTTRTLAALSSTMARVGAATCKTSMRPAGTATLFLTRAQANERNDNDADRNDGNAAPAGARRAVGPDAASRRVSGPQRTPSKVQVVPCGADDEVG